MGQGVDQDYNDAAKWCQKAAKQGHAQARFNLGVMYSKGQGTRRDHSEAVKWYRRAAEQKYARAQNILGLMYSRGQGFEFVEHQKSKGCKIQKIAIMSGRWTNENIKHAKRLGCHMFKKPFKIDEIEKWLDECEKELDHNSKLTDMQTLVN